MIPVVKFQKTMMEGTFKTNKMIYKETIEQFLCSVNENEGSKDFLSDFNKQINSMLEEFY